MFEAYGINHRLIRGPINGCFYKEMCRVGELSYAGTLNKRLGPFYYVHNQLLVGPYLKLRENTLHKINWYYVIGDALYRLSVHDREIKYVLTKVWRPKNTPHITKFVDVSLTGNERLPLV